MSVLLTSTPVTGTREDKEVEAAKSVGTVKVSKDDKKSKGE